MGCAVNAAETSMVYPKRANDIHVATEVSSLLNAQKSGPCHGTIIGLAAMLKTERSRPCRVILRYKLTKLWL
jgi:hypothetical protein